MTEIVIGSLPVVGGFEIYERHSRSQKRLGKDTNVKTM